MKVKKTVEVADHLWAAVEQMAQDMGVTADAVVSQALFLSARLSGYVVPGKVERAPPPTHLSAEPKRTPEPEPELEPEPEPEPEDEDAQLLPESEEEEEPEESLVGSDIALPALRRRADPPEEEEPQEEDAPSEEEGVDEEEAPGTPVPTSRASIGELFISVKGGKAVKVNKDRFVIGRGKHCDYVVDSNRVSREHAVIVRDGAELVLEDLGSSNGTWFNKKRISRKKINDGDQFFLGSEPMSCAFRSLG